MENLHILRDRSGDTGLSNGANAIVPDHLVYLLAGCKYIICLQKSSEAETAFSMRAPAYVHVKSIRLWPFIVS